VSLRIAEKKQSLQVIRQYQSEVAEICEGPAPRRAQYTLHAIALFLVGVVLIAVFGQTDRIISSLDGMIVPVEQPVVVQAFDQGVIRSIDVRSGEKVTKGQLLGTMDPTFTQALVDQYRAQVYAYTTEIARDEAEIQQKPLQFLPSADADFNHYAQINLDLYNQQMANFRAQLVGYDQQIALTKTTVAKYQNDQSRYLERVDIQHQIEGMYSTLQQHGTGSMLNALTSSDTRIDTARQMEFDKNSAEESIHQLQQQQAAREAFVQQFLATTSQDLATSKVNLDGAKAQLDSAAKRRELVRFVAPEDAEVMSIANLSVGSVLQAGNALFTLTPLRVPLEVEIKISPSMIGFVRVGDPVQLQVDAFQSIEHGVIEGTVRWISEDIVNPNKPQPTDNGVQTAGVVLAQTGAGSPALGYYKARIVIGKLDLHGMAPTFRLNAGMTLTANIKVGTHSIGAWLVGAATKGTLEAMRAP
jgi:hemolysin D